MRTRLAIVLSTSGSLRVSNTARTLKNTQCYHFRMLHRSYCSPCVCEYNHLASERPSNFKRQSNHSLSNRCQSFTSSTPYKSLTRRPLTTTSAYALHLQSSPDMCTTYKFNYLRCQREVKRDCIHTDHFPCESGMCKDVNHEYVTLGRDEKCPVHTMIAEKKVKSGCGEGKKMEEWPETNCRPM